MPSTTNFSWTTPADTDLVKDGALAIRTLGNGIDTSLVDLKGGTTGQVLSKATNTDLDYTWTNVINNTLVDAKGDIITATAADTPARLGVGADYRTLQALSTETTGLVWGGGRTSYTPSWTASTTDPTIGNGSIVGNYVRNGNAVSYNIIITMGSTTTFGSGRYKFSLPFTSNSATYNHHAYAIMLDNGVSWYYGYFGDALSFGTTSTIELRNAAGTVVSNTAPFTFGNTDAIYIVGQYVI